MDEDVVADFTGRFVANPRDGGVPTTGRIILTDRRLVAATTDDRLTIALSTVLDVNVGAVPQHVADFFDDTVTVGYRADGAVNSIVIERDAETISTFVALLFRCLLKGLSVAVKHPARVGGRRLDALLERGTVRLPSRAIEITGTSSPCRIDVANVMNIDRKATLRDGADQTTLSVTHVDPASGQTTTTELSPATKREVNLLGRYLRLEFDDIARDVADLELTDPERRVLVALHATGGDIDFGNLLDGDPTYVTNVLNAVSRKELIVEGVEGISLTAKGRIVVSQQLEQVNV